LFGRTASFEAAAQGTTSIERTVMNKDQVKGRVEEAKGNIKEQAGKAVGNPNLRDEGTADKVSVKVKNTYVDAKEKVKDAVDKA
jgi:uncharacterized protein YjbJ (UPF0337 family)